MVAREAKAHVRPAEQREIRLAPRLARTIVAIVIAGYGVVDTVRFASYEPPPLLVVLGALDILVILLIQLLFFMVPERRNGPLRWKMLILQAILIYAPFPWFGIGWLGMPSFLASSCLLVLPPAAAWTAMSATVVTNVVQEALFDEFTFFSVTYIFSSSVNTALVVYGLSRMAELVTELDRSRAALAQMAVEKERLRFARDLHDLLGYSLSTVILKIELSRRLGRDSWDRASEELDDVLRITRQALADVRMVSSGYRQMSLLTELESVRSVLSLAGIEARIEVALDISELSSHTSTVLSTVLREGITNMLRHSDAQRCDISVEQLDEPGMVRLRIANDGLRGPLAEDCIGSGIANLTMRVEAGGGRLRAEVEDGWFTLDAELHDTIGSSPEEDDSDPGDQAPPKWWRPWNRKAVSA